MESGWGRQLLSCGDLGRLDTPQMSGDSIEETIRETKARGTSPREESARGALRQKRGLEFQERVEMLVRPLHWKR